MRTGELGDVQSPATSTPDAGLEVVTTAETPSGRAPWRRIDLLFLTLIFAGVCVLEYVVRALSNRPLWYDELWRAYYLSLPKSELWHQLPHANTPSAAGWMVVTRGVADGLGWWPWVLRLPELVALPFVGVGMYLFTRRYTGPLVALGAGVLVGFSGSLLDLGWQLKPYTIEAIVAMAVLGLWARAPAPGHGSARKRLTMRTFAGGLTLFTVPLAFLLGPLAVIDVLQARGGWRARLRAALECAPALAITGAHSLFFIARQSAQRNVATTFWNKYFLAHRTFGGALHFIWQQLVDTASTTPPGMDRSDVNVVHPHTNGAFAGTWLLAPAFLIAFVIGARVLLRRRDGQLVVGGLLGAELLILVASWLRYWPFGPVRTNLFLVPLLTVVPAVGISSICSGIRRYRWLLVPSVALVAASSLAIWSAAATTVDLSRRAHWPRLIDGLPRAADDVRHFQRPGDLVVVAGRLVVPGWKYSTTARAGVAASLPPLPAGQPIFVATAGDGVATAALANRSTVTSRVLLFDLIIERYVERRELAELRRAGWCQTGRTLVLAGTGRLTVLTHCKVHLAKTG